MLSPSNQAIQQQLARTWSAFFARHGNLTATQQAAIPAILQGQNTLLIAPTATGKTEAVIAPLLERHLLGEGKNPRQNAALCILYISPTRALVRDLYERLLPPLSDLGISLMMKSGDTGPVPVQQPPTVLITTPESLDSLLTRAPRLFGSVQAIVLDEIHLFDATPRGDHLRCLLRRIDHIRAYRSQEMGEQRVPPLQRLALSATVPDAAALARRYLTDADPTLAEVSASPTIVQIAGVRQVVGRWQRMANLDDLVDVLDREMSGPSQLHKSLVFCNARYEVEQIAAFLRQQLPFEATIFVHYSNLDATLRREVEEGLAQASVAVCVCTSTLELGIDIGSIDLVVLVGPPPSPAAFVQRIGRAGRRRRKASVVGMARSPLEEMRFQALFHLAETGLLGTNPGVNPPTEQPFCLSVLVQQIFSILKQSPTGGIRLADLRRITPASVQTQSLQLIFNHLVTLHYLTLGRAGEWRAGVVLQELRDYLYIYCIFGGGPEAVVVVDSYYGGSIAQTERLRAPGETLFIGGRRMEVLWRAQYRLGVRVLAAAHPRNDAVEAELHSPASPFAVSLTVSQTVATLLGFAQEEMALLQAEGGIWLFHFWGDLYGEVLAQLLRANLAVGGVLEDEAELPAVTRPNEHCLQLATPTTLLPAWNAQKSRQQLYRLLPRLEPFLELGRFHALLPPALATETMIAQIDLPCFEQLYRSATIVTPTTDQRKQLLRLVR